MVLIDQLQTAFENALQFQGVVFDFRKVNNPHGYHLRCLSVYLDDTIPHDTGAGVDAKDDLLCCLRLQSDTFESFKSTQLKAGRRLFFRIVRVVLFAIALAWLYIQIGDSFSWSNLKFKGEAHLLLYLMLLLPLNSLIEILKWHYLTTAFSGSGFAASIKGVLTGQFYALFTPNRIGDGAGRLHYLPKGMKSRGTFAFVNASIAQSLATLMAGAIALVFADAWLRSADLNWFNALSWIRWFLYPGTLLLLLLYIEPGWMQVFKDVLPQKGWLGKRVQTLQVYSRRQHAVVLALSVFRYAVFATQFYLALQLYGFAGMPHEAFLRIAIVYLFSTLIPTAALAEFGIRESMAVLVLPAAGMSPEAAFSATLVLYLVNICIPALAGGLLFIRMKKVFNA